MNIVLDERVSAIVDAIKKDPLVAEIIRATVQWVKEEPTKRHCHLFREVRMWLLINYEIGAPFTKVGSSKWVARREDLQAYALTVTDALLTASS